MAQCHRHLRGNVGVVVSVKHGPDSEAADCGPALRPPREAGLLRSLVNTGYHLNSSACLGACWQRTLIIEATCTTDGTICPPRPDLARSASHT